MKRFKNILFFADGRSDYCPALERAIRLADSNQASLTVVDVIEELEPSPEYEAYLDTSIIQLLHDHRLQALENMVEKFQTMNRKINTQVLTGTPFVKVIHAVLQNKFDLVIKSTHTPARLRERLLGSTDLHLLRKCPCPVWIDRSSKTLSYKKIVAAVDPLRDQGEANLIMDLATSLARIDKSELEVIHAWHMTGESMLRSGRIRIAESEIDELEIEEKKRHACLLDALLKNYELTSDHPRVHLVKGDAAPCILEYSADANLIVMGTVGRVGIPGFIIGNTAEEVLQNTQASILAVKPDSFHSPLA